MTQMTSKVVRTPIAGLVAAWAVLAIGCGGDREAPAAGAQQEGGQAPSGQAGAGPDTSGLGAIVLDKINEDPGRQDLKVTGKLLEFTIVTTRTEVIGDVANAVVECAGVVEFDGDADWGMSGQKKAGEPAKFECQAEYLNQGQGWELFGPMGIYPL